MEAAVVSLVNGLVTLGMRIALAVFVVFILLAGWQLLTSGGSTKGQEAAKNSVIYAVIGLAVCLLARVISSSITNLLPAAS